MGLTDLLAAFNACCFQSLIKAGRFIRAQLLKASLDLRACQEVNSLSVLLLYNQIH